MQNDFTKDKNNYPVNTAEAYNLLANYKTSYKPPKMLVYDSEDVLFANVGGIKGKSNLYKIRG